MTRQGLRWRRRCGSFPNYTVLNFSVSQLCKMRRPHAPLNFSVSQLCKMRRPHALVLTLPPQGHINPILNLSLQLAVRGGFIITFVNTQRAHRRMLEANHSHAHRVRSNDDGASGGGVDIRFVCIPDGCGEALPGQAAPGHDIGQLMSRMQAIREGIATQQGVLEDMVLASRATPNPITCIISDSFPWTQAMANKLRIKNVVFWTLNATTLATALEMKSGKLSIPDDASAQDAAIGGVSIGFSEFLAAMPAIRDPQRLAMFKERVERLHEAACVVLNTLQELEAPSLQASSGCETSIRCVGPLLPPGGVSVEPTTFFPEESSRCMAWLDEQAAGSVLYVSFGSMFSLSAEQLQELALGIEASKQRFLWAARDYSHLLPDGFLHRTRGQGLVVCWAPQRRVLGHAAVTGFLTHCGWNSTVESIHMGVPMLCYPICGDQHLNALLITRCWGLGIGLQKDNTLEHLVARSEVEKAVAAVMGSEVLHLKAAEWMAASRRAVEKGGSSYAAIGALIEDLKVGTAS